MEWKQYFSSLRTISPHRLLLFVLFCVCVLSAHLFQTGSWRGNKKAGDQQEDRKALANQRLWDLMEMPRSTEDGRKEVQGGAWGLGDLRTLDQFIHFTGVSVYFFVRNLSVMYLSTSKYMCILYISGRVSGRAAEGSADFAGGNLTFHTVHTRRPGQNIKKNVRAAQKSISGLVEHTAVYGKHLPMAC